jgi:hypothetical protein
MHSMMQNIGNLARPLLVAAGLYIQRFTGLPTAHISMAIFAQYDGGHVLVTMRCGLVVRHSGELGLQRG